METLLWVVGLFLFNMIVGAGVWAAIDDEAKSFYHWYNTCPREIAWIAQPLILTLWPVALYIRRRELNGN